MTVDAYSHVDGVIIADSVTEAKPIEFNLNIKRDSAAVQLVGEWSPRQVPSTVDIDGSITMILDDGLYLAKLLNATPLSGTAQTIVAAGASLNTAGPVAQAGTNAGNGIVRLTMAGATTATLTRITLTGTNIAGSDYSEVITIPAGTTAGMTFDTKAAFATITYMTNSVAAGSGATCGVASLAGATSATIGAPKTFTIIGKLVQGTNNITFTMNNCFFTSGAFKFAGKTKGALEDPLSFKLKNPNTDFSMTYVNQ